ncbi:hypothetical protein, partial [Azotobacter chroococcum]|uniref:hypothetical protein n=1 Tax=Azotobacter chroococcum TaxID=353 RepID=UPI001B8B8067
DELSFTATACLPNLPEPAANPLIFKGLRNSCGGSGAHYRALTFGVNSFMSSRLPRRRGILTKLPQPQDAAQEQTNRAASPEKPKLST